MNKQCTKAVIFDMDGVLVDSEPMYFEIERYLFSYFKVNVSKEQHEALVGTSLENMWEKLIKDNNLKQSKEKIVDYHKKYVIKHVEGLRELLPTKNIKELLEDLKEKDIKIGLASSSPKDLINIILNKLNIKKFFQIIVSGDEVEKSKPHPEIFIKVAQLLNVAPNECVVIEDSSNGVNAAVAAGMKCIGFSNPHSGKQNLENADIIINEFPNISSYLDI
ncbi:beta-phosphoglucomutase family hydrolase [Clostridium saccharoperbutylacetonicum]|uniref:Beta-phosphoglucomutase n=1 Tax=Clostridium saccharoperbutylacetonicum N1-4(HMT) TaxID=931276 RepID=M1MHY1_9CLOT|nr:HAD family hydrolase [Clostridium saccharoperbutylacetonicum]AGF55928.1 haloacid dehalogenase-like hydrolase, putative [Clostridium saccharoperbutylacetonicum N1-4(HMT)]NRT63333.1 beta-phosphoglucomutase family hydrolase [Clostridium saccharoperbutylacetonicum]NSB26695.1 beta-phosphoglucomutase family hydrolase [Clostridium saccharoperbutylacetonicum]NSB46045.1 beta-phosphoglucomutase family hydrolase [Clostridium saccharoperbutylacetonicum]